MRSFEASLADTLRTFQSLAEIRTEIDCAGEMILSTLRRGNKLIICGNGGSAAEAAHFATELTGRYAKNGALSPRSHFPPTVPS
jgi:D-sedoheptulose 7-phosphate isomerase